MKKQIGRLFPSPAVPVDVVLAVMEIEAWFLAEHTHFQRIDSRLTCEAISHEFRFDPSRDSAEAIRHPSNRLDEIYHLVSKHYHKREADSKAVIKKLDSALLYDDVPRRAPRLRRLLDHIDAFLSGAHPQG